MLHRIKGVKGLKRCFTLLRSHPKPHLNKFYMFKAILNVLTARSYFLCKNCVIKWKIRLWYNMTWRRADSSSPSGRNSRTFCWPKLFKKYPTVQNHLSCQSKSKRLPKFYWDMEIMLTSNETQTQHNGNLKIIQTIIF